MTKHDDRKHAASKTAASTSAKRVAKPVELTGVVVDVFGRRFTLEADAARSLIDLGKLGAGLVIVEPGARLRVTGERRKGEIKAQMVAREGGIGFLLRKDKAPKLAAGAKASRQDARSAPTPAPAPTAEEAAKPDAKSASAKPAAKSEAKPALKPEAKPALGDKAAAPKSDAPA